MKTHQTIPITIAAQKQIETLNKNRPERGPIELTHSQLSELIEKRTLPNYEKSTEMILLLRKQPLIMTIQWTLLHNLRQKQRYHDHVQETLLLIFIPKHSKKYSTIDAKYQKNEINHNETVADNHDLPIETKTND